uniref:Uncharacterized protein n=1 Tax=Eptatretus burgeri TaxID=7764 RepID=A0A8C4Q8P0_EPTBU
MEQSGSIRDVFAHESPPGQQRSVIPAQESKLSSESVSTPSEEMVQGQAADGVPRPERPITQVEARWPLARYSRFERPSGSAGCWQDYDGDGKSGILLLSLTRFGHMMVTHGNLALENTPVFDASIEVAGKRKNDCIYFTFKIAQGSSRIFCVWFAGESHEEVQKNCTDCIHILRQHIPIDESLNQPGIQSSQISPNIHTLNCLPKLWQRRHGCGHYPIHPAHTRSPSSSSSLNHNQHQLSPSFVKIECMTYAVNYHLSMMMMSYVNM